MRETKILSQESYKDLRKFLEDLGQATGKVCYCKSLDGTEMNHSDLRTTIKSAQMDGIILYQDYKTSGYLQLAPPDQSFNYWRVLCYRVSENESSEQFKVLLRAAIRRVRSQGGKSLTFVDNMGCQILPNRHNILSELGFVKQDETSSWKIRIP